MIQYYKLYSWQMERNGGRNQPDKVNNQMMDDIMASRKSFEGAIDGMEAQGLLIKKLQTESASRSKLKQPTVNKGGLKKPTKLDNSLTGNYDEFANKQRSMSGTLGSFQPSRLKKPTTISQLNSTNNSHQSSEKQSKLKTSNQKMNQSINSSNSIKRYNTKTAASQEQLQLRLMRIKGAKPQDQPPATSKFTQSKTKVQDKKDREPSNKSRGTVSRFSMKQDRKDTLNNTISYSKKPRMSVMDSRPKQTDLNSTNRSRRISYMEQKISPESSRKFKLSDFEQKKPGAEEKILKSKKDQAKMIQGLQTKKTVQRASTYQDGNILSLSPEQSEKSSSSLQRKNSFDLLEDEDPFGDVLEKRSNGDDDKDEEDEGGIVLKEGQVAQADDVLPAGVVVSARPLNEPRIYANRLLGKKVNFNDKIILRKQNGKVQKIVQEGEAKLEKQKGRSTLTSTTMTGLVLGKDQKVKRSDNQIRQLNIRKYNFDQGKGLPVLDVEEIQRRSLLFKEEQEQRRSEMAQKREQLRILKIEQQRQQELMKKNVVLEKEKEEEQKRLLILERLQKQKEDLEERLRQQELEEQRRIDELTQSQIEYMVGNLFDPAQSQHSSSGKFKQMNPESDVKETLEEKIKRKKEAFNYDAPSLTQSEAKDFEQVQTMAKLDFSEENKEFLKNIGSMTDEEIKYFLDNQQKKLVQGLGLKNQSNFQELHLSKTDSQLSVHSVGESSQEYNNMIERLKQTDLEDSHISFTQTVVEEPQQQRLTLEERWKKRQEMITKIKENNFPEVEEYFIQQPAWQIEGSAGSHQEVEERLLIIQVLAMGLNRKKNILKHLNLEQDCSQAGVEKMMSVWLFSKGSFSDILDLKGQQAVDWKCLAGLAMQDAPPTVQPGNKSTTAFLSCLVSRGKDFQQISTDGPKGEFYQKTLSLYSKLLTMDPEIEKEMTEYVDSLDQLQLGFILEPMILISMGLAFMQDRRQQELALSLFDQLFLSLNLQLEEWSSGPTPLMTHFEQYMCLLLYIKAMVKMRESSRAFTLLQIEFAKQSSVEHYRLQLLYQYAKLVVKSESVEFYISALGALDSITDPRAWYYRMVLNHRIGDKIRATEAIEEVVHSMQSIYRRPGVVDYTANLSQKKIIASLVLRSQYSKNRQVVEFRNEIMRQGTFYGKDQARLLQKLAKLDCAEGTSVKAHLYFFSKKEDWRVCIKIIERHLDKLEQNNKLEYHVRAQAKVKLLLQKLKILKHSLKSLAMTKETNSKSPLGKQTLDPHKFKEDQHELISKIRSSVEQLSDVISKEWHVISVKLWMQAIFQMARCSVIGAISHIELDNPSLALALSRIEELKILRKCIPPLDLGILMNQNHCFKSDRDNLKKLVNEKRQSNSSGNSKADEGKLVGSAKIMPVKIPVKCKRSVVPRHKLLQQMEKITLLGNEGDVRRRKTRQLSQLSKNSSRISSRGNRDSSVASGAYSYRSGVMQDEDSQQEVQSEDEAQLDQLLNTKRNRNTSRPSNLDEQQAEINQLSQSFFLIKSRIELQTQALDEDDLEQSQAQLVGRDQLTLGQRLYFNKQQKDSSFTALLSAKFIFVSAKLHLKIATCLSKQLSEESSHKRMAQHTTSRSASKKIVPPKKLNLTIMTDFDGTNDKFSEFTAEARPLKPTPKQLDEKTLFKQQLLKTSMIDQYEQAFCLAQEGECLSQYFVEQGQIQEQFLIQRCRSIQSEVKSGLKSL